VEQIDTLINARWMVPVEPAGLVLDDHALAIRGDRIVDLLPQDEAQARYRARAVHELPTHVLIPGLVNAHAHAAMALLRGYADDLPLMTWLSEHIWPAEARHVGAEFVHDGSQLGLAEMLRGGTTCVSDMYFFPDVTAKVAAQMGMRAAIGMILIDFPSAYAQTPDEYFDKGLALHDEYLEHPLITTLFAPHAPYTVAERNLERVRVLADELDVPIHMHVHETAAEVARSVEACGQRPLARLHALGLLSPALIAVHMTQLTGDEIALLGEGGVHVVHCPESNLKLASGFCPVEALRGAGVNVALGTDGAASNNDLDMFGEMRTAALLAKAVAGDAAAAPAHAVLEMATLNGARALGLGSQIGSLRAGKCADVAAVDLGGIESEPVYNPVSQLVYAGNRSQVSDVWVAGRHLLQDRAFTSLDRDLLLGKARRWRDKIAATQSSSDTDAR
jgi:5-methylthioadenosine/S-adenosylhomocysteine deaminase